MTFVMLGFPPSLTRHNQPLLYDLQVVIPSRVLGGVNSLLNAHLSKKSTSSGGVFGTPLYRSSSAGIPADEGILNDSEPLAPNSVARERILRPKSLQLRHKQEDWQVYLLMHITFVIVA